jgi:hypothetical protein
MLGVDWPRCILFASSDTELFRPRDEKFPLVFLFEVML